MTGPTMSSPPGTPGAASLPASSPASAASASPAILRPFTVPGRVANQHKPRASSDSTGGDGIETLFTHDNTKIVSFTAVPPHRLFTSTKRSTATRSETGASLGHDNSNSIPWRSATERTLAVGVLRIYRVTSSNVSFLNSGNLLHTIFPKSQCWCVDGESIFALRVRQDLYYRIELPCASDDDKEKIQHFKLVLAQVLRYQQTRSPFKKAFEMDMLPEYTRLEPKLPEQPQTPTPHRSQRTGEKAKKWMYDKTWVPEDGPRTFSPAVEGSDSNSIYSYDDDDRSSIMTDPMEAIPEGTSKKIMPPLLPSLAERATPFQRSVTAPLELIPRRSSYTPSRRSIGQQGSQERGGQSVTPSRKAKGATKSMSNNHLPSFSGADEEFPDSWSQQSQEPRGRSRHRRHLSEATVRAHSADQALTPIVDVHPSTPQLISDSDDESGDSPLPDVATPKGPIQLIRLAGLPNFRPFSSLKDSHTLLEPGVAQGLRRQFTTALLRRTCEIVLGPPAHLVAIMLRIASKVVNGMFGFNTYRVRDANNKVSYPWDTHDQWQDEDDFGIPIGNYDRSQGASLRKRGVSGGVD